MPEPFIVHRRVSAAPPEAVRRLPGRLTAPGSATATAPVSDVGTRSAPAPRRLPDHPALEPLRDVLSDPEVTDVFINGADGLFVDRGRGVEQVAGWQAGADELRALAVALIGIGGRHLDDGSPDRKSVV